MWHQRFQKIVCDTFTEYQKRNNKYSLRAYAKRLEVSPSTLSELMRGGKKISLPRAIKILSKLDSPQAFKEYQYLLGLESNKGSIRKSLPAGSGEIIRNWEYFAIHSLLSCDEKPLSMNEVAQRLGIDAHKVEPMFELLTSQGLIEDDGNGFYVAKEEGWTTTDGISEKNIVASHFNSLDLAKTHLSLLDIASRDFISLTFPADPTALELARKETRKYKDRICEIMQGAKNRSVFRLQVQLFDLTSEEKMK